MSDHIQTEAHRYASTRVEGFKPWTQVDQSKKAAFIAGAEFQRDYQTEMDVYEEAFNEAHDFELSVQRKSAKLLADLEISTEQFKEVMEYLEELANYESIELVSKPEGEPINEKGSWFSEQWVDQYGPGMGGDDYHGHIYVKISWWRAFKYAIAAPRKPIRRWLKIPYQT